MTIAEMAVEHARSWFEAWNRRDLDAILDHYVDDVVFRAPTVVRRFGRPDGVLRGKEELRVHFQRGLEVAPALRFDLEAVFTSPAGSAMLYTRESGNRVVEVVEEFAEDGRARRVTVYYAREQP